MFNCSVKGTSTALSTDAVLSAEVHGPHFREKHAGWNGSSAHVPGLQPTLHIARSTAIIEASARNPPGKPQGEAHRMTATRAIRLKV
jgi:hypothetical protein